MRPVSLFCGILLLFLCRPVLAAQKSVTFYLDGARVEQEVAAPSGYLEFPLPESFTPGSLRVKPVGSGRVLRVELAGAERDRRRAREIARLEERKEELQARMQALSAREEIFTAAAKSQSGKAPKRSRSNPDPLESLQQGTGFALSQLDAVYRGKRNTQRALDKVEHDLAQARKKKPLARIWLKGKRAVVSYQTGSQCWSPCYDFRWSGRDARGELLLRARLPEPEKGVRYLVANGTALDGGEGQPVQGEFPVLSRHLLLLRSATRIPAVPMNFTFDPVATGLPPGEAAAYWGGEFLGNGRFAGGGASELSVGGSTPLPIKD